MFDDSHYEKFFSFPLNLAKDNLYPGEKSKVVAMVFKPTEELCVKEQSILKCQVRLVSGDLFSPPPDRMHYYRSLIGMSVSRRKS